MRQRGFKAGTEFSEAGYRHRFVHEPLFGGGTERNPQNIVGNCMVLNRRFAIRDNAATLIGRVSRQTCGVSSASMHIDDHLLCRRQGR